MPTLNQPVPNASASVSEGNGTISRDAITIISGAGVLSANTVLGRITASGKYGLHDNALSDGREVAAGVLYSAVDATSADAKGVAWRRACELANGELIFKAGISAPNRAAAIVSLAALNIITRA